MQSAKSLLFLMLFSVLLSGCGLSGPLYLADGSETIKPDAPDNIDQQINTEQTKQTP